MLRKLFVPLICNLCVALFSHYDDDYISIDDLPVQDARLVRADGNDSAIPDITEERNPFESTSNGTEDWSWLEDAVKDIAYYLRSHKFNEYDRRYEKHADKATREFYLGFPRPPLRSLHWEVHKFCDVSFVKCAEYLWGRVKGADLRRTDDTAIVIQEQRWTMVTHLTQINSVELECRKLRTQDDTLANPFLGPLERFQWRTTASYYMCWYSMNEVSDLGHLNENCDNFAHCLEPDLSWENKDFRAKDTVPFSCAMYSFCPDPCCQKRHLQAAEQCWESPENPCYAANSMGQRECVLNRTQNTDFRDIVLNHWNVTCRCPKKGYVWNSAYGLCVDIDECSTKTHTCKHSYGEACLNTIGGFKCVCKWGHAWVQNAGRCTPSEAIALIKLTHLSEANNKTEPKDKSLLRRLFKKIFHSNNSITNVLDNEISIIFTSITTLIVVYIS